MSAPSAVSPSNTSTAPIEAGMPTLSLDTTTEQQPGSVQGKRKPNVKVAGIGDSPAASPSLGAAAAGK